MKTILRRNNLPSFRYYIIMKAEVSLLGLKNILSHMTTRISNININNNTAPGVSGPAHVPITRISLGTSFRDRRSERLMSSKNDVSHEFFCLMYANLQTLVRLVHHEICTFAAASHDSGSVSLSHISFDTSCSAEASSRENTNTSL